MGDLAIKVVHHSGSLDELRRHIAACGGFTRVRITDAHTLPVNVNELPHDVRHRAMQHRDLDLAALAANPADHLELVRIAREIEVHGHPADTQARIIGDVDAPSSAAGIHRVRQESTSTSPARRSSAQPTP